MKFDFKGITTEELSYKLNRVRFDPQQRLDIKPQFSRQVRKSNENPNLSFVVLSVKIESTAEEPKPFDINVSIVGIFEIEGNPDSKQERQFAIDATALLYPYLRAMVANLTAQAYVAPLNLPMLDGPLFPEDRDVYAFTVGGDN